MSRVCDICGKGVIYGNRIARRGMSKAKGGIGLHITGVNGRTYRPNIQKIRIKENGRVIPRKVCAACLKSGKVAKA